MTALHLALYPQDLPGQRQATATIRNAHRQDVEMVAERRAVEDQHDARVAHLGQKRPHHRAVDRAHVDAQVHQETAQALDPAVLVAIHQQVVGQARQRTAARQIQGHHEQSQVAPAREAFVRHDFFQTPEYGKINLLAAAHRTAPSGWLNGCIATPILPNQGSRLELQPASF